MARKAFYSFHYKPDASRAGQVRNIGVVEGNTPVSDNDWETVTKERRSGHQEMDCQSRCTGGPVRSSWSAATTAGK